MVHNHHHFRKEHLREERSKRRLHHVVPWIKNPLQGVDNDLHFAPRHEASTIELFFDLFFVANLATFTAYQSITDHSSALAYVGFFVLIWLTWFQVTLHDVRFAHDTIYERVCKTIQMIAFTLFALVGSAFSPGTKKGDNMNFRYLCYTMVITRVLLTIQYMVVAAYVIKARRKDVYLPLFLNVITYAISAGVFAAMVPAFPDWKPVDSRNAIYSVWWIVAGLESIATITISCIWRMLSFKKTHLVERMGLLTLIVIGEGAIGVTKTVSRIMGKQGLEPEGGALVVCIVLVLVAIWMTYFDHQPHGHYGTIRQQIWSCLHLPLHLAIVGVVEGSQQVTLARYIHSGWAKLEKSFVQYCFKDHLDGDELSKKLNDTIYYFELPKKVQSLYFVPRIGEFLDTVTNATGICGDSVTGKSALDLPDDLASLYNSTRAAIYASLGNPLPSALYTATDGADMISVAMESWKVVHFYFWIAMLVLLACFILCIYLIRRNKSDAFDWVAIITRAIAAAVAAAMIGVGASPTMIYTILASPVVVPVAVGLLYLIIILDRLGALVANWRNRSHGGPIAMDHTAGHEGHEEHETHGGDSSKDPAGPASVRASQVTTPLVHSQTSSTSNPVADGMAHQYFPVYPTSYSPQPYTPPAGPYSPQPGQGYPMAAGQTSGGYAPVSHGQQGHGY